MPDNIATVRLSDTYAVAEGSIFATVFVGEAQRGRWTISVGNDDKGEGLGPQRINVGDGKALAGATLVIEALVNDTNPFTNMTSLRITLEGGPQPKTSSLQHVVTSDGASVFYVARYLLDGSPV